MATASGGGSSSSSTGCDDHSRRLPVGFLPLTGACLRVLPTQAPCQHGEGSGYRFVVQGSLGRLVLSVDAPLPAEEAAATGELDTSATIAGAGGMAVTNKATTQAAGEQWCAVLLRAIAFANGSLPPSCAGRARQVSVAARAAARARARAQAEAQSKAKAKAEAQSKAKAEAEAARARTELKRSVHEAGKKAVEGMAMTLPACALADATNTVANNSIAGRGSGGNGGRRAQGALTLTTTKSGKRFEV